MYCSYMLVVVSTRTGIASAVRLIKESGVSDQVNPSHFKPCLHAYSCCKLFATNTTGYNLPQVLEYEHHIDTFSETYQQLSECCHQQFASSIYKQTHRSKIVVRFYFDYIELAYINEASVYKS